MDNSYKMKNNQEEWICSVCVSQNTAISSKCAICHHTKSKTELKQKMHQNIHKICYCMKQLTKISTAVAANMSITICLCCFDAVDATKTQLYRCEVSADMCIFHSKALYSYTVCDTCFTFSEHETSDWNDETFTSVKLASIFDVITTKINSITNQIEAKACMKHVFEWLYTPWISKLKNNLLDDMFYAFYNSNLEKI
eukprot:315372_1